MSDENVMRVRRGVEAFNRGDFDVALAGLGEDVEWHVPQELPDAQVYRGPAGIRQFWEAWSDMFDEFQVEVTEVIDAGDEVVAMIRVHGRGKESGVEVDTPVFPQVWTFRDGRPVKVVMYPSREEALRAAGVEGQPPGEA